MLQLAAEAENDDNISEQKRQHGKRVRYGEVIQVGRLAHLDAFAGNRNGIIGERKLTFTFAIMLSPVRLSSVCLFVCTSVVCSLSCALLRRFKFSALFLRHWAPWPSFDTH